LTLLGGRVRISATHWERLCNAPEIARVDAVRSSYLDVVKRVDAAAQRQTREFVKAEADDIVASLQALASQLDRHGLSA
jgi:hypothetical protein